MRIKKTQAIASMVIDRVLGLSGPSSWPQSRVGSPGLATPEVRKLIMVAWLAVATGVLVLVVIFSQILTRMFPQMTGGHSRMSLVITELREMSTTYRGRLDVVVGAAAISVFTHGLNVVAFYLVGRMLFPSMATTLVQHFLMVPLTLFTMAVPLPFGALGLSEEVSQQLFKLVAHPRGALAMMAFRSLSCTQAPRLALRLSLDSERVRRLTASAHDIDDELIEGERVSSINGRSASCRRP